MAGISETLYVESILKRMWKFNKMDAKISKWPPKNETTDISDAKTDWN